jgi:hypothetical protein
MWLWGSCCSAQSNNCIEAQHAASCCRTLLKSCFLPDQLEKCSNFIKTKCIVAIIKHLRYNAVFIMLHYWVNKPDCQSSINTKLLLCITSVRVDIRARGTPQCKSTLQPHHCDSSDCDKAVMQHEHTRLSELFFLFAASLFLAMAAFHSLHVLLSGLLPLSPPN